MTNKTNQKKPVQKTTQTRKNTVESPKPAHFFSAESSRLTDFSTPVYNMGVTTFDSRLKYDEFTFPRRLDNLKMVLTEKGNVPVLQINGTGCALARKGWEVRLYQYLTSYQKFYDSQTGFLKETGPREPKLTRVDLAYDDFEGQYITVDQADEWDDVGGFWCGGRQPKIEKIGPWKRPNGKGRTFAVGDRTSGKYCRFYERGKKEGSPLSPWVRAEVEFKSKDRYIPLDILLSPSQYFLGAYPCFEWLAKQLEKEFCTPEKTKVVKKQSEISWDKAIEIVKEQFGKYIRQFSKVVESQELINMISSDKDEVPKRLKFSHAAVMQSIRLNQHFEPKPSSLDEMPLFVGKPLVNMSAYKEFINAI